MRAVSSDSIFAWGLNVGFAGPNNPAVSQTRFVEGSETAVLEEGVQAALDEFRALNQEAGDGDLWQLLFIDFSGAGDGHKFMVQLVFGASDAPSFGDQALLLGDFDEDETAAKMLFSMAQSRPELDRAREQAWRRLPDVSPFVAANNEYVLVQTLGAGASQGLRYAELSLTTQDEG